jgi:hypothetical protein
MLANLWVMIIVVRFFFRRFSDSSIASSECESSALVASSNSNIGAFLRNARAIANLCFYPPDNVEACGPMIVL